MLAAVCAAHGAEPKTVFDGREWRLSPECRIEGNVLTVTVPKDRAKGMHAAKTIVDLTPFEEGGFEAAIRVRGEGVTVPPQPHNGVKFMFHYRNTRDGEEQWPGARLPTGDFGWRLASIRREKFAGAAGGTGELVLGLQDSSGTVAFDLSTFKIVKPRPYWPVTNQNHRAVYTPDVAARIYVGEFSAVAWAEGAERYLNDCIEMFEEYGWDWSYHAFREWAGWSVEHEGTNAKGLHPSADNPRKRALLKGFNRQ